MNYKLNVEGVTFEQVVKVYLKTKAERSAFVFLIKFFIKERIDTLSNRIVLSIHLDNDKSNVREC